MAEANIEVGQIGGATWYHVLGTMQDKRPLSVEFVSVRAVGALELQSSSRTVLSCMAAGGRKPFSGDFSQIVDADNFPFIDRSSTSRVVAAPIQDGDCNSHVGDPTRYPIRHGARLFLIFFSPSLRWIPPIHIRSTVFFPVQ